MGLSEGVDPFRVALKSLINLSVLSLNANAKKAGINAAAVSRYLGGENALGDKNRRRLLHVLGLNVETKLLDPRTVHVWFLGNQLDDLRRVLSAFNNDKELFLQKVQVDGNVFSPPKFAADEDTFLLHGANLSVVIVRTLTDGEPAATPLTPEEYGAPIKWGGNESARVSGSEWKVWLSGMVSEEQFLEAKGRTADPTWDDIKILAQQTGVGRIGVWTYLKAFERRELLKKMAENRGK